MLHKKIISKNKTKTEDFSKLKIDLKIFNKKGKLQSNKMIDLYSYIKNNDLTIWKKFIKLCISSSFCTRRYI